MEYSNTKGQRRFLLHARRGKDIFLTGDAGTGKTAVLKQFIEESEQIGKSVIVMAPTGIAAVQISGTTIHRAFGFPVGTCINTGRGNMSIKTRTPKKIRHADIIVIDEISMVRIDLMDAVLASIEKIEKEDGKHIQVIVIGDFFQLPPVNDWRARDEYDLLRSYYGGKAVPGYAFLSEYWARRKFFPVILTEVVRVKDSDRDFIRNLNLARRGDCNCIPYFNQRVLPCRTDDIPRLYPTNAAVQAVNLERLSNLPGRLFKLDPIFEMAQGADFFDFQIAVKEIHESLVLKDGADVILLSSDQYGSQIDDLDKMSGNYIADEGPLYYNGSLAQILGVDALDENDSNARLILEIKASKRHIMLYRSTYPIYGYKEGTDGKPVKTLLGHYRQFPVKLAFAVTVHRSQGRTYQEVVVDPRMFTTGQMYVALSRVTSLSGLYLTRQILPQDLKVDPVVSSFYTYIEQESNGLAKHKMGRPAKYKEGASQHWVPTQLEKHIRAEIEKGHLLKLSYSPAYKSDRVQLYIPDNLWSGIKEEIAEWKRVSKKKRAQSRKRDY